MGEAVTLLVFAFMLLGCVATGVSVLYALVGGLACFSIYTLHRKYTVLQLGKMIWKGVKNSRTILLVFVLIGFLTAVWRASGTIPCIVYYSASSMMPRYYLVFTFLLCCGMSSLTGTSFGTASTMGVICASIGRTLGVPPMYIGGAVMSGIYVGEQCSPMSSSALLVCELTGADIYVMIPRVMKRVLVPLFATGVLYLYLGRNWDGEAARAEGMNILASGFYMGIVTWIPAGIIVLFSLLRLRVEFTMLVSIIAACVICVMFQGMEISSVIEAMIRGYHAKNPQMALMMDGGGLYSMAGIGAIVAISSAYFGIFSSTDLLLRLKEWVLRLAHRSNAAFATVVVSVITCAISCNQTLATMLTCEMTKPLTEDKEKLALNMETSVIVIAGLLPWSIACAFPLSVVGAPMNSLFYASYLYLVPLWMVITACYEGYRGRSGKL